MITYEEELEKLRRENTRLEKVTSAGEIGRIVNEEIVNEYCKNYILYGTDPTCVSEHYLQFTNSIEKFKVHQSDIWVASYPKSGTAWVQEMVWMIANDLDFEGAKTPLGIRFPFLERSTIMDGEKLSKILETEDPDFFRNSVNFCANQRSPRFLKTHLPVSLLPDEVYNRSILDDYPKIIYVWRNPKDVCVSYYHHGNLLQGWRTKLENFSKVFMADRAQYGSYWQHVLGYWRRRHCNNMLFLRYEDLKAELPEVLPLVGSFLEKILTHEQIDLLCNHLSFESMKKNKAVNEEECLEKLKKLKLVHQDGSFFRSGTVGKYKEELSPEMIKKFDTWIKDSISETSFAAEEYDFRF